MMLDQPGALIVEDQPFVGMVVADVLREAGFHILHVHDFDEAARQLQANPDVSLMIVEASLPVGGSGVDFAARIALEHPHVQLLIAVERGKEPAAPLPPGARLLRKPFASGELRALAGAREFA